MKNGKDLISNKKMIEIYEEMGDEHILTSLDTPMKEGAFDLSDEDKIEQIQKHFREIMDILGLDLTDDSLKGTPYRVAKMYVKEIFSGLNPANKPKIALFENKYQYNEMLIEKNILLQSTCEHHFLPIYGKAHVAYIANGKVIGISKINRVVQHFAKRPQVQERLSLQILEELKTALGTEDLAVYIDAKHMCVSTRGIQDISSSTITTAYSGKFKEEATRKEFLAAIHSKQDY
ncbi:MAG: GTP cyclohydrolase I [Aureispira sp.]|jgi:GTP cyclohydrolase I